VDGSPQAHDEWKVEVAERRKSMLAVSVALACFLPADAYVVGRADPLLVAVRLGWALFVLGAVTVTRWMKPAQLGLLDVVMAVGSTLFMTAIVHLTGGADSLYLPWLLVMPVALMPFGLRDRWPTALVWAMCTAATVGFLVENGAALRTVMVWLFLFGASGFAALYGTAFHARLGAALRSVRAAREQMALQLAEAERVRGHAERLALVGQLAAGVAHEINNPLAFVNANLAFVRVEAQRLAEPARSEVIQALHEAERGVERIQSIVRDLRVFARKDQEAPELCYLGDIVSDAALLVRASALVALQCTVARGLPPVRAVARHLGQVLLNILVNAADALEELPPGCERDVRLDVYAEGGEVCVRVEDSGPGLRPELRDRVFEPFFTTKPVGKGTGLGLALSREYVERYGGRIVADNCPEGGARFTIRLPAVEGAPPADSPWEPRPLGDPDMTPVPRKGSGTHPSA
jgi:two-component system, NtrC family, sensor kinase